jgi:RHS repeat-associated protein
MPPFLTFYYLCHINPEKIMELLRYFYHPDHLGSSSWITDNTGRPIQHLHYLPFGEDWVDQRTTSWNTPYTFSGKEKDVETGYGYFGARYYDSGLSIWLSVDPMSDKYPSMSPYNYCANNPVILVDPDGRDIYTFDEQGYLLDVEENKDVDRFVIKDKNNETIAESKDFAKGTVKGNVANFKSGSELPDATMLATDNTKAADEIFQFMADNTNVEWGLVNTESDNCTSFLGTNHVKSSNNILNICIGMGDIVERSVHNHPSGSSSVSEGDHYNAIEVERRNPNIQLYNYTSGNGYTRYNSKSDFIYKYQVILEGVEVKP